MSSPANNINTAPPAKDNDLQVKVKQEDGVFENCSVTKGETSPVEDVSPGRTSVSNAPLTKSSESPPGITNGPNPNDNLPQSPDSNIKDEHNDEECDAKESDAVREPPPRQRFPERLHEMILILEREGKSSIIGFCEHGRAFVVRDRARFNGEELQRFFPGISDVSTFQRQLSFYGFDRIKDGRDKGGYWHRYFLRGRLDCIARLKRRSVNKQKRSEQEIEESLRERINPLDFYHMDPIGTMEQNPEGKCYWNREQPMNFLPMNMNALQAAQFVNGFNGMNPMFNQLGMGFGNQFGAMHFNNGSQFMNGPNTGGNFALQHQLQGFLPQQAMAANQMQQIQNNKFGNNMNMMQGNMMGGAQMQNNAMIQMQANNMMQNRQMMFGNNMMPGMQGNMHNNMHNGTNMNSIQHGNFIQGANMSNFSQMQANSMQGMPGNGNIQGMQANNNLQGMQGNSNMQMMQGNNNMQSNNNMPMMQANNNNLQGVQSNSNAQGMQANNDNMQGIQASNNVQGMQASNNNMQGMQAKSNAQQGIQANNNNMQGMQGSGNMQGMQANCHAQGMQASNSMHGMQANSNMQGNVMGGQMGGSQFNNGYGGVQGQNQVGYRNAGMGNTMATIPRPSGFNSSNNMNQNQPSMMNQQNSFQQNNMGQNQNSKNNNNQLANEMYAGRMQHMAQGNNSNANASIGEGSSLQQELNKAPLSAHHPGNPNYQNNNNAFENKGMVQQSNSSKPTMRYPESGSNNSGFAGQSPSNTFSNNMIPNTPASNNVPSLGQVQMNDNANNDKNQ